jgi:hypothetical protein
MADSLYLSLWYPNLRLEALPGKLTAVLGEFAAHGGEARVYAATVWPVSWSEAPVFQRIYGHGERGAEPARAVEEALELLHDDYAYEFQVGWSLWELEQGDDGASASPGTAADPRHGGTSASPAQIEPDAPLAAEEDKSAARWVREPRLARVTGFGPLFDEGAYEQDGHIRIDFGSDAAFLEEDADLDEVGAQHVEDNLRQLVELAGAVEKRSGATARLLWSELGESLGARLAARLGLRN